MKRPFLLYIILFFAMGAVAAPTTSVLSYKEWKTRRIQESVDTLKRIEREGARGRKTVTRGYSPLEQAQLNVKIAKGLTPNDYFLFYLNERFAGNRQALEIAAKKMSPKEVADIMMSYQNYRAQENPEPNKADSRFAKFHSSSPSR